MTIETIKDVLGRILAINKNMTTESLKNLLDASGWDTNDIQEGMRIYRDYVSAGNDMSKVVIQNAFDIEQSKLSESEGLPTPLPEKEKQIAVPSKAIDIRAADPAKVANVLDILNREGYQKAQDPVKLTIESKPVAVVTPVIKTEAIEIRPQEVMAQEIKPQALEIKNEYAKVAVDDSQNKPWPLIIFNVILFIIIATLLVYIILN